MNYEANKQPNFQQSYEIWIEESQKRAARDWDWDSFDQEINGFVTCYLHPVGQGKG